MRWFDPEVAWAAGFFEGEGTITQEAMDLAPLDAILLEASKAATET